MPDPGATTLQRPFPAGGTVGAVPVGTGPPVAAAGDDGSRRLDGGVRAAFAAGGALVAALGAALLRAATFAGHATVGAIALAEGVALLVWSARGRGLRRAPEGSRLRPSIPVTGGAVAGRRLALALGAVTTAGLAIRLVGIDGDFWLDEVVTVRDYASRSVGTILTSYEAVNNHLLHSLLAHAAFLAFGYDEWAIRLPALVAGVATIPVFFWVARPLVGDLRAVGAAGLLAVASPHILFSQNARGYTLSLLFGLAATGALTRGLREDRVRWWAAYVPCAVLSIAAVPIGAFVIVGHGLVCVAALVSVGRHGGRARHLGARLAAVAGLVVAFTAQIYAPVLAGIPGAAQGAWRDAGAGPQALSIDFLRELLDAVSGGAGLLLVVAVPCAAIGAVGAVSLWRRDWPLLVGLTLGPLLNTAVVAARGLAFSPRFLLFLIFPILLVAVESIDVVARRLGARAGPREETVRRVVGLGGLAFASLLLVVPFVRIAGLPNQPYSRALARAAALRPGALLIGVFPADSGVRFYAVHDPPGGHAPLRVATARTRETLDRLVASAGPRGVVVLTSQAPVLRGSRPALYRRVQADFVPVATLAARIGDGAITVRLPRRHG